MPNIHKILFKQNYNTQKNTNYTRIYKKKYLGSETSEYVLKRDTHCT